LKTSVVGWCHEWLCCRTSASRLAWGMAAQLVGHLISVVRIHQGILCLRYRTTPRTTGRTRNEGQSISELTRATLVLQCAAGRWSNSDLVPLTCARCGGRTRTT
jgi:hypothetical protein